MSWPIARLHAFIIALTTHDGDADIHGAVSAGASAYLLGNIHLEQ